MKPGIYKHSKTGNLYKVHFVAKHSETLEDMVVYEALYQNDKSKFWARPIDMFEEKVEVNGKKVARFEFVKETNNERPKIGVGVIIRKGGKVLMGKRKNSHGDGTWSFPGGHLEMNESIEGCAERELGEEVGIKIKNLRRVHFTNDIFKEEKKHYVTLFLVADYKSGVVKVKEPEKLERWEWREWSKLPKPLFLPIVNLLKVGFDPFSI